MNIRDNTGERFALNNKVYENARCFYTFEDGYTAFMRNGSIDEWRCTMIVDEYEFTSWDDDIDILHQAYLLEEKYPGIMLRILKKIRAEIPKRPGEARDYIRYEEIYKDTLDEFKEFSEELKTEYEKAGKEPLHRFIGWIWMFCIAEQNRLLDDYTVTIVGANLLLTGIYRVCCCGASPLEIMQQSNVFNKKDKQHTFIKKNFERGYMDNDFFRYSDWAAFKAANRGRGGNWLDECYRVYAKKKDVPWLYVI